jgi:hypothetical protein
MTNLDSRVRVRNREACQYLQNETHTSYGAFSAILNIRGLGCDKTKRFLDKEINTLAKMYTWANSSSSEHIDGIGPVMLTKIRKRLSAPTADNPTGTHPAFKYGLLPILSSAELSEVHAQRQAQALRQTQTRTHMQVWGEHSGQEHARAQHQRESQEQTQRHVQAQPQPQNQMLKKLKECMKCVQFGMLDTIEELMDNGDINEQAYNELLKKLKCLNV